MNDIQKEYEVTNNILDTLNSFKANSMREAQKYKAMAEDKSSELTGAGGRGPDVWLPPAPVEPRWVHVCVRACVQVLHVCYPFFLYSLSVCCSHSLPFSQSAPNPVSKHPAVRQPFKKHSNTFGGGAREERGKLIDRRKPSGGGGGGGARKSSSSSSAKDGGAKGGKGKDKVPAFKQFCFH